MSLDGKTQGTLKFSYKVGRTEEYQLVGYASPNPGVMVGSIFKVLGEEITVALILVGVSFGVAQTADSLLWILLIMKMKIILEVGFGQLVKEV